MAHADTARGAEPERAVGFGGDAVDQRRTQRARRQALEVTSGPARDAALGAGPQAAIGRDHELADFGIGQAARVARPRHEARDLAVAIHTVQAANEVPNQIAPSGVEVTAHTVSLPI